MRLYRVVGLGCLAFGSALVGCNADSGGDASRSSRAPERAGQSGDPCAPGAAPDADEHPEAQCALKTDYHVPDLGDASHGAASGDGDVGTRTLAPLDNAGAARASCNGKTGSGFTTCGSGGTENCCRSTSVPAGQANANVAVATAFELGVYEVTSGRFKAFVDAFQGNLRAAAEQGAIPGVPPADAQELPASRAAVDDELGPSCKFRSNVGEYGARTWPDPAVEAAVAQNINDANERAADIRADATPDRLYAKPINCVSYYMAEAFCAWDGGRLPTNVEWVYAALGGNENRRWPWGAERTKDKLVTDLNRDANSFTYPEDFPYYDNFFNAYHIAPPGRKPAGVSRYGQHDMGGNVLEWVADRLGPANGIARGGSWEGHDDENAQAYTNYPLDRTYGSLGFRCAYGDAQQVAAAAPAAPPAAEEVPVYRGRDAQTGDHLQGLSPGEGAPAYTDEGVAFRIWRSEGADTRPLYRCRIDGTQHHFLSNQATCEGQVAEGLLGWVGNRELQGTQPIYRCVGAGGKAHLSTLTPKECKAAGLEVEGTQGFARP